MNFSLWLRPHRKLFIFLKFFRQNFLKFFLNFYFRLMSKVGELALLLAETITEKKSIYAGVPSRGEDPKEKQYLQLAGRILLVLMFMNLIYSVQQVRN